MVHRILPQQREVRDLYEKNFEKMKGRCEISQALSTPYKQTMADESKRNSPRNVPLMNTIMEGEYFKQEPTNSPYKLSRYEAQRIHFRGFVPDEDLGVNVMDQKQKDPISKEAREQALRRGSTPNFVQENKRILRKMSEHSRTRKQERASRPQSAAQISRRPSRSGDGPLSPSTMRKQYNGSRPSTRRGGSRPASATMRRSIASLPSDVTFENEPQRFVGQSPNTPSKVRYQPTYRHAEIVTTCERAQTGEGSRRRRPRSAAASGRPFSASSGARKLVPDYDDKRTKQNVSGFSINTRGGMQANPRARKSRVERRNKNTKDYYHYKDRIAQHREAPPPAHQIKMAIHSPSV